MRRGNLPDGGHDKVTRKRGSNVLKGATTTKLWDFLGTYHSNVIGCFMRELQETSQRHSNGTSWIRIRESFCWPTTETSLGVSFETCLRRHGDVLMGRRYHVLLRCRHDAPIRPCGDVPLRCFGKVPPRSRWVFHLRRTYNVTGTYRDIVTMSPRSLVSWWVSGHYKTLLSNSDFSF